MCCVTDEKDHVYQANILAIDINSGHIDVRSMVDSHVTAMRNALLQRAAAIKEQNRVAARQGKPKQLPTALETIEGTDGTGSAGPLAQALADGLDRYNPNIHHSLSSFLPPVRSYSSIVPANWYWLR
jgi:hypothetical protein